VAGTGDWQKMLLHRSGRNWGLAEDAITQEWQTLGSGRGCYYTGVVGTGDWQ
ncbi:hypothetical protein NDU88_000402, partial [Pleurodeles waltl]